MAFGTGKNFGSSAGLTRVRDEEVQIATAPGSTWSIGAIFGKWETASGDPGPHSENPNYRECATRDAAVHSRNNFREVHAIRPEAAERGRRVKD
jgi:hypothetical protein